MASKVFKCWCGYEDSDFLRFCGHVYSNGHDKISEENIENVKVESSEQSQEESKSEEESAEGKKRRGRKKVDKILMPVSFEEFYDYDRNEFFCLFCVRYFKTPEKFAKHLQEHHTDELRKFLQEKGLNDAQIDGYLIFIDLVASGKYKEVPELISEEIELPQQSSQSPS